MTSYDPSSVNGLLLCGKFIPETALETLLSFVPLDHILKLRQVCQVWNAIASRRSFWKEVFERNGSDWTAVGNHVKEKEKSWMILYSALKNRIFTKNFVQNHSGHSQFEHWEKLQDRGDRIIVESPPAGVGPLPPSVDYDGEIDSAFVTSYGWSTIQQKIDLREAGLTPEIMKAMIPFQFVSTQMIGTRFDCGGMYCVCLGLLDKEGKAVVYNLSDDIRQPGDDWLEGSSCLNIMEKHEERLDSVEYLTIIISAKDSRFWAGHYGPKFSRISIRVKCLTSAEAQNVKPHQLNSKNEQVSHLFYNCGGRMWSDIFPNRHFERYEHEEEHDSPEYSDEEMEEDEMSD